MTPDEIAEKKLSKKDFVGVNDVRWCPGCGDYAILNAIQTTFPQLGVPRENFVVVSGIGCSSRFPYYMNTYGFHTIHGRAPTFATGVKVANPELSVWVITGDGDGLSIGGNHLLHLLRRNIDVNVLLFNNRIYGLTKGQFSPTSEVGKRTKSSPMGSLETPINPLSFALAAEATFVARTVDNNPKHMVEIFKAAAKHRGTSFIEIMQNCVIFNDKTWGPVAGREVRDEELVMLEEGKPLIFGKEKKKGLQLKDLKLNKVVIGENGVEEKDILVHSAKDPDPTYSYLLTHMSYPEMPTPMGVFRAVAGKQTFEDGIIEQIKASTAIAGRDKNLQTLLKGHDYWEVADDRMTIRMPELGEKKTEDVDEEMKIMDEQAKEAIKSERDPLMKALGNRIRTLYEEYDFDRIKVLSPNDPIAKAISHFNVYHVDCLLVLDDGKLEGIVTERDILRKVCLKGIDRDSTPISEIMTKRPDKLNVWSSVGDAINHLSVGRFRHLPIELDNGKFSVISIRQLLVYIYDQVHK